jgi:hypothetical protein
MVTDHGSGQAEKHSMNLRFAVPANAKPTNWSSQLSICLMNYRTFPNLELLSPCRNMDPVLFSSAQGYTPSFGHLETFSSQARRAILLAISEIRRPLRHSLMLYLRLLTSQHSCWLVHRLASCSSAIKSPGQEGTIVRNERRASNCWRTWNRSQHSLPTREHFTYLPE